MARRLHLKRLEVEAAESRRGSWTWRGRAVVGTEHIYAVRDGNYDRLNTWKMAVQVPRGKGPVIVRAIESPGKAAWAGIERKSMVFNRATQPGYRKYLYCKATPADPSGRRTKFVMTRGERGVLPSWFRPLQRGMRLKSTVATTRGTDARAQVLLARPDDHRRLIGIFFAFKVWVLDRHFQLAE